MASLVPSCVDQRCLDRQGDDHQASPDDIMPGVLTMGLDAQKLCERGMLLGSSGKFQEAVTLLEHAVLLDPAHAAAHSNLGVAYAALKRFDRGEQCFRRSIDLWPRAAQPQNNLASCLAEQGRHTEAIIHFECALRLDPDYPEARFNLALALRAVGRLDEAAAALRHILRAQPHSAAAHRQLAATLAAQGNHRQAIDAARKALELAPDDATSHLQLGVALRETRRYAEACAALQRALRLAPANFDVLNNLGIALTGEDRPTEALDFFARALQIAPQSAAVRCNTGIALAVARRFDEAIDIYREALAIDPDCAEVHNNLGMALASLMRYGEASACYDRALELKPDYPDAHRNRSLLRLLHGDFAQGWPEYEWRFKCRDLCCYYRGRRGEHDDYGVADGDFQGKTVLFDSEQGLGDTIQFIRYASLVKARGGKVAARVPRPLATLLAGARDVDRLLSGGDSLEGFDVRLPMMSLPRVFATTLETVPNSVPYVSVDKGLLAAWRAELEQVRGFRVGIAWQGNPRYPEDRQRSIPLAHFAALAGVPRVRLISLQRGRGSEQLLELAGKLTVSEPPVEVDREHGRFVDTAAIMKNLDLVITSDSAVAHLAGALGVPVWLALPNPPDWRWLLDREDSPWYPTMRLFRQTTPGDWEGVFRRIRRELRVAVARASSVVAAHKKPAPASRQADKETRGQGDKARMREQAAAHGQDTAEGVAQNPENEPPKTQDLKPKTSPCNPKCLNELGVELAESGKPQEAMSNFKRALWLDPRLAEAHHNLGATFHQLGQFEQAAACFRRCLRFTPRSAEGRLSLGAALACLRREKEAEAELRRALRLSPLSAGIHYSLGNVLASQGRWADALACFRSALAHDAQYADAYVGIGNVLRQQLDFAGALAAYENALRLRPDLRPARRLAAETHLLLGDFARGWNQLAESKETRTSLAGARLLLTAGDDLVETLLLLRFSELAKSRGANIWVRCPAAHVGIIHGCPGIDLALADDCQPPLADVSLPLIDLPFLVGSPEPEAALGAHLLRLDESITEKWRNQLDSLPSFKIGVDWICEARDGPVPHDWIKSLEQMPGIQVVRLTSDEGEGEEECGLAFSPDGAVIARIASPADMAAVIANLDLVVATDGVCAHLAGALGVPLFVVLPVVPRWCWHLKREESPWYPAARLFRQSRRGDWSEVCKRLDCEIKEIFSGESAPAKPQWAEAERLCAQAAALMGAGDAQAAIDCFQRAAVVAPGCAAVYNNLGSAYLRLGRWREAVAEFRQALKRRPHYSEALVNLGSALAAQGEHAGAAAHFRQAVRLRPRWAQAHLCLANSLLGRGADLAEEAATRADRWRAALPHFSTAARLAGDDEDVQVHWAVAQRETGRIQESVQVLEAVLRRKPDHVGALNNLAIVHCRQKRYWLAIECLERALRRWPNVAAVHNNLGIALAQLQRYGEAMDAYRRALAFRPDYAEAHNNLGISLTRQGRNSEALASFRRASELRPDYPEAYNNQGIALRELGRSDEALACYGRAIEMAPDYAEAHLNRGFACLLRGDLLSGWREYEWRFTSRPGTDRRFAQPRWDGSSLAGKTLLVDCEQGLGDSIQFVRYAALIKRRGGRVAVRCQPRMVSLLGRVPAIDQIVAEGEALPAFDCHIPLLSLPGMFGTTLETVPGEVPYLSAEPELVRAWGGRLRATLHLPPGEADHLLLPKGEEILLVGINWQGNVHFEGDQLRSFPVACFAPLAQLPGVRLVSLQKGIAHEQLVRIHGGGHAGDDEKAEGGRQKAENESPKAQDLRPKISDCNPTFLDLGSGVDESHGAFMDTAAIMMNLDLVITSDTAVAHLAGALARPVWLALPYSADWRWLLEREDSPWYPTMRLYRQKTRGDWTEVFERIKADLHDLLPAALAGVGDRDGHSLSLPA